MPVSNPGEAEPCRCAACGDQILERYYLLAVDKQWHVSCLKCSQCHLSLDSQLTCFAKDGQIYCKHDYYRLFGVKRCARCDLGISANEMVMRARDYVYHLTCFSCASCDRPLTTGDHFGLRDRVVYCDAHYDTPLAGEFSLRNVLNSLSAPPNNPPQNAFYNGVGATQKGRPRKRKSQAIDPDMCLMQLGESEHQAVRVLSGRISVEVLSGRLSVRV
ncbi:hypothetical protein NP493_115g14000 [Ridgeia piscesae]|uniref:LIM zinc-binding domain-containing protein n=1 Tax=Ridgeia piscesae TaxID=27915 RepID=A0AAD9UH45_RIDPI|nr:hypothetical protein NP493_115g14000 [Ridgeia piscesae]